MIQGIINRLAMQSFAVKQWSFTLVVGLVALSFHLGMPIVALVGTGPILLLWGLDGYFLMCERLFRELYDDTVALSEEEVTFSMSVTKSSKLWTCAVFSVTLKLVYGLLLALLWGAAMLI